MSYENSNAIHYSGKDSLLLEAIEKYGERCMLGGVISDNNPITKHHIERITSKKKSRKQLNRIENIALVSKKMHERFNLLEHHFPTLAREINMYLYLFKGNYSEVVLNRINKIMEIAKRQEEISSKAGILKEEKKPLLNADNYRKFKIFKEHFPGLQNEILSEYLFSSNNIDMGRIEMISEIIEGQDEITRNVNELQKKKIRKRKH